MEEEGEEEEEAGIIIIQAIRYDMKGLKLQVRSGIIDEEGILLLRLCTVPACA